MNRTKIKVGMKVVCKKPHYNEELYWAFPYMDEAIGKPMTVIKIYNDKVIYCEFNTSIAQDDGRWAFLSEWLEPWTEERNNNMENSREAFMAIVYDELYSDGDNYRANRIIDAADEYVDDTIWSLIKRLMGKYDEVLSIGDVIEELNAMEKGE